MSCFYAEAKFAPCSETPALSVRHGRDAIYDGSLFRESFAPDCWMANTEPAPFRLSHDSDVLGTITSVAAVGQWHHATILFDDGPLLPLAREKVKAGARISIGCRSLRRDQDDDLRIVRHTLCRLEEIALVGDGEIAGHVGAIITSIYEPKPTTRTAPQRDDLGGYKLQPGDVLIEHRASGDVVIARGPIG